MKRKVLILGKNGQLAQSFAKSSSSRLEFQFAGHEELDLRNTATIEEYILKAEPEIVVNAAAYTKVDLAETERAAALTINARALEKIGKAAQALQIPVIHFSTDYVFQGDKPSPYVETDPVNPINYYGFTKLQGEEALLKACEKAIILRVEWLYSEFGHNFFNTMLKFSLERETLNIVNDQIGSPTYCGDLAQAVMSTFLQEPKNLSKFGIYHLTNEGFCSWYDFAVAIFERARQKGLPVKVKDVLPISTEQYPTPANRPRNSRLNCERIKKDYSIQLRSWNQALDECFSARMIVQGIGR